MKIETQREFNAGQLMKLYIRSQESFIYDFLHAIVETVPKQEKYVIKFSMEYEE